METAGPVAEALPPGGSTLTAHVMRRLLRQQIYFAVLAAAVIWFLFSAQHVIPLFIFAFLLAYLLSPVVGFITRDAENRRGFSRTGAILSVYALLIVVLSGAVWLITGRVVAEIHTLSSNFPTLRHELIAHVHESEQTFPFNKIPDSARISIDNTINNLDKVVGDEIHKLAPTAVHQVPGLLELLVIPILAYYLLKDGAAFIKVPRAMMRESSRARYDLLVSEINESLRGYLKGQVTLSLVAAVSVFIMLTAFGVHYAYLVAITAFFLELIPIVGPLLWAASAVLLTYVQQPNHAIFILLLVTLAHQLDMHILGPKILGGHLRLHPAVVIAALVSGTAIFGLLGALLAAPAAALLNITVRYMMNEGALSSAAIFDEPFQHGTTLRPRPKPVDQAARAEAAPRGSE